MSGDLLGAIVMGDYDFEDIKNELIPDIRYYFDVFDDCEEIKFIFKVGKYELVIDFNRSYSDEWFYEQIIEKLKMEEENDI